MEDEFLGHPVSSSPPFPPRKQKVRGQITWVRSQEWDFMVCTVNTIKDLVLWH